jgi:ribosomal protein S27E
MLNPNFDIREERNFLELSCRKCRNEKIRIAIRKRKNLKFFCRNCEKEDSKKEIENLFGQFSSNSENFEKYRITPENFSKKLQLARKKICEENYELLSVEGHRLILKCPKHGIFRPWLYDFLFRNTKCPECQNEKRKNTVEKYNEILKKFDIEIVFPKSDEKIGTKSPVLFHCRKHHVFFTSSLLYVTKRRYKCPECRRTEFTSSGWENEVAEFVSSLKIEISRNCRIFGNFEIDILVKNSRIAIECNGLYFHSSKFLPKNYHVNKTEQLERRNYRLIHIFEDEWKFHRNAVRNVLKYVLNRAEKGVPARKITSIRKISFSMARNFHEKHSLQKATRSTFHYGAFFNDELVACMSFSKRRNFENSWKMTGFCTNGKCHAGLFSRMLKHFEKENRPLSITANVDRRWFTGSTLKKNGFVLVKITEPRRWYVHENRRSTENSQKKNLSKIYDCGTLVFVKNFS